MSVLGIIAEYDPFHNGHLHHLRTAVETILPSAVLVALSGPFKQRGEPALLSPFLRAECALAAGADAVFSLPVCWTVRDAEHYALGAVSLLASLGATHLAFGAENADLSLLQRTADLLENPSSTLNESLHAHLREGFGYPAALSAAVNRCFPESGSVLEHPNNILAVCYLRALRRLSLSLVPVPVSRSGAYHSDRVDPEAPSASALRSAFRRGAWGNALEALPVPSRKAVQSVFLSGYIPDSACLDALLLSRLRSMTPTEAAALPDCSEGLENALLKAAAQANSREKLISLLTGRRYSSSRISRICTSALLHITAKQLFSLPLPASALLLGIRKSPSLNGIWKKGPVQISDMTNWCSSAGPADLEAWRVWSQICGLPDSWFLTQKVVTVR